MFGGTTSYISGGNPYLAFYSSTLSALQWSYEITGSPYAEILKQASFSYDYQHVIVTLSEKLVIMKFDVDGTLV